MYRKRFEPQRNCLPGNYSGWAADSAAEEKLCHREEEQRCAQPQLPCPGEKSCGDPHATDLTDLILIGAVMLLICTLSADKKPDLSLLIPLGILLIR